MAGKKVTLYIDDNSLRLLVSQGQTVKGWAYLPLEAELVKNNVITDETEVAARIRQLLKSQKIRSRNVIVGISGLRCLSRPMLLPPLPKEVLGDVVVREAKKLLPVPLEQVFLSWQTVPAPEGKTKVFLTTVPRNTTDALYKTLRKAGLQPVFLGVKPLVLAKLARDVGEGIVLDVQNNEFDIVILSGGIPQPVRTVAFPGEGMSWEEKLPVVINDTERTIAFYNTNNPDKQLPADVPIFVSGDLVNETNALVVVGKRTGRAVIPLSSPLASPGGFDPNKYLTNVALSLQKVTHGTKLVEINALPEIYQPKKISLINIFGLPAAVVLAGVLAVLFIIAQTVAGDIIDTENKLTREEQQLTQKSLQKQELTVNITRLEKQLSDIQAETGRYTSAIGSLDKKTSRINGDLNATMALLPQSIKLKGIAQTPALLTVSGRAANEYELLGYVDKLSNCGVFADVTVTNVNRNPDGTVDFNLLGNHEGQALASSSLEIVINSLPPEVNLLQVSYGKDSMSISGKAPNQDSIVAYVQKLEDSRRFRDITLNNSTEPGAASLQFTLILKIGG